MNENEINTFCTSNPKIRFKRNIKLLLLFLFPKYVIEKNHYVPFSITDIYVIIIITFKFRNF